MKKRIKICIPEGVTVVWKKGIDGKIRPTTVKRRPYCKWIVVDK